MWKWETEEKPKAVIVIVHSAYEHHRRYAWLIEKLRSSDFHIVMGDLPGHGEQVKANSVHEESFEEYIEYIKKALKVAVEYDLPIFLLGHGLGATLIMKVFNKLEVECAGIILTSPWLELKNTPSKWTNALAKLSVQQRINHDIQLKERTRNYEEFKLLQEDRFYRSVITNDWYKELQYLMKSIQQSVEPLTNIPVLLMTGERDKIIETSAAKQWLKKQELSEFQWKEWKNCYHDLYLEPEREEIFIYELSFINNALRAIGYIV